MLIMAINSHLQALPVTRSGGLHSAQASHQSCGEHLLLLKPIMHSGTNTRASNIIFQLHLQLQSYAAG